MRIELSVLVTTLTFFLLAITLVFAGAFGLTAILTVVTAICSIILPVVPSVLASVSALGLSEMQVR